MNGKHVVWGVALAVALLTGCDKDEAPADPAPVSPTPPAPNVTPKADADAATGNAGRPLPKSSGDVAADEEGRASVTTAPDPKSGVTRKRADDAAAAKTREAEEHLSKTAQHLKDQKPDLARKSLEQVEAMQGSLPKTLREQVKTMRANVDSFSRSVDPPPQVDEDNK